jgi:hypothetical protein
VNIHTLIDGVSKWILRISSIGRINPTSQHHMREIRANNQAFDPDQTGNFTAPFPEDPHQQPEFPFFLLVFRLSSFHQATIHWATGPSVAANYRSGRCAILVLCKPV